MGGDVPCTQKYNCREEMPKIVEQKCNLVNFLLDNGCMDYSLTNYSSDSSDYQESQLTTTDNIDNIPTIYSSQKYILRKDSNQQHKTKILSPSPINLFYKRPTLLSSSETSVDKENVPFLSKSKITKFNKQDSKKVLKSSFSNNDSSQSILNYKEKSSFFKSNLTFEISDCEFPSECCTPEPKIRFNRPIISSRKNSIADSDFDGLDDQLTPIRKSQTSIILLDDTNQSNTPIKYKSKRNCFLQSQAINDCTLNQSNVDIPTQFEKFNQSDIDFLEENDDCVVTNTQMVRYREESPVKDAGQLMEEHKSKVDGKLKGYDKNIDTSESENNTTDMPETSDEEFINDKTILTQYPSRFSSTSDLNMSMGPLKTRRQRLFQKVVTTPIHKTQKVKKRKRIVLVESESD